MTALQLVPAQPASTLRRSAARPIAQVLCAPVVAAGACTLIAAGATGSLLVLLAGLAAILTGLTTVAVLPSTRRIVARCAERRLLADRRRDRCSRVYDAHPCHRIELDELTAKLSQIELVDPVAVDRYRLDDVLDDYAELAVSCQRTVEVLATVDRPRLDQSIERLAEEKSAAPASLRRLHARLLEQRARRWDESMAEIDRSRAQLALIADLVRLLSERAATGALPDTDIDALITRLEDLDEAERQLEAV
jgi:hypothetical protein